MICHVFLIGVGLPGFNDLTLTERKGTKNKSGAVLHPCNVSHSPAVGGRLPPVVGRDGAAAEKFKVLDFLSKQNYLHFTIFVKEN